MLESRDLIGGVWAFTNDARFGGVMTTTQTTSSRCITEISDFPMPETYADFPSHAEVLAYLKAYCAKFDLDRHIQLNRQVTNARKIDGIWDITCADGQRYRAKNLTVCSGVHQHPTTCLTNFRSTALPEFHSAALKKVSPDFAGKTAVVWGRGESASDITLEVSKRPIGSIGAFRTGSGSCLRSSTAGGRFRATGARSSTIRRRVCG